MSKKAGISINQNKLKKLHSDYKHQGCINVFVSDDLIAVYRWNIAIYHLDINKIKSTR